MWDNMFRILIMNLGYIAVFAIFFLLAPLFTSAPAALLRSRSPSASALLAVYTGAVSRMCAEIADYRQPGFPEFFHFLQGELPLQPSPCAGRSAPTCFVVSVAFQFYGGMKSLAGPLAVALLFWVTVAWALAASTIFPSSPGWTGSSERYFEKPSSFSSTTPASPSACFICALIVLVVSVFTALLLPGHYHDPPLVEHRLQAAPVQVRLARAEPGRKQAARSLGRPAGGGQGARGQEDPAGNDFPWKE